MKWVFWASLVLILYTYAGYPLWLFLRTLRRRPPSAAPELHPFVSILMAVQNEEEVLPRKLCNLAELDYPAERRETIVVSDGSTDGTNRLLALQANERFRPIVLPAQEGKAVALNRAIEAARGEILVFVDARQMVESEAVRRLVADFADPMVGCVSGELMIGSGGKELQEGAGIYWRMEKKIREWESLSGSVVQATGALYALRRELAVPLPPGTILDDVYLPLNAARRGKRILFEPRARAWDSWEPTARQEFRRKVRTLTGNYQLLQVVPWLLTRENPLRWELISHKLLRLVVPFALAGLLVSSLLVEEPLFRIAAVAQVAFYGFSVLGLLQPHLGVISRLASVPLTFLVLNTAAVVALFNFLSGKRHVWAR